MRAISLAFALMSMLVSQPALAQAPAEIRVGTSGTANTVLALWMADAAGLYAAQISRSR